jgi:hypothetical protein
MPAPVAALLAAARTETLVAVLVAIGGGGVVLARSPWLLLRLALGERGVRRPCASRARWPCSPPPKRPGRTASASCCCSGRVALVPELLDPEAG